MKNRDQNKANKAIRKKVAKPVLEALSQLDAGETPSDEWLAQNPIVKEHPLLVDKVDFIYRSFAADPDSEPADGLYDRIQKRIAFGETGQLAWHNNFRELLNSRWATIPMTAFATLLIGIGVITSKPDSNIWQLSDSVFKPFKQAAVTKQSTTYKIFDSLVFTAPGTKLEVLQDEIGDTAKSVKVNLLAGSITYAGQKLKSDQNLSFFIDSVEFAIKGTRFALENNKDEIKIVVSEGQVEASYHPVKSSKEMVKNLDKEENKLVLQKKHLIGHGKVLEMAGKPSESAFEKTETRVGTTEEIREVEETYVQNLDTIPKYIVLESAHIANSQEKALTNIENIQLDQPVYADTKLAEPITEPAVVLSALEKGIQQYKLAPGMKITVKTTAGSKVTGSIIQISSDMLEMKAQFGPYKVSGKAIQSITLEK